MKKIFLALFGITVIAVPLIVFAKTSQSTKTTSPKTVTSQNNNSASDDEKLKEEIGQMLLIGFRGTDAPSDSYIAKVIKELKIGGVILFDYDNPSKSFPRNIIDPTQTKNLIASLQSQSKIPLIVSVDAEGGNVNRLKEKYGFLPILSAKAMAKKGTTTTSQESKKLAKELKDLGFNMNFAPVVDVNVNPKNPIIGALDRSFSANEAEVAKNAKAFIIEQKKLGIIPVEKHFPGHGSSTADSHLGLVDVTKTYQQKELIPYTKLQQENMLDVVMTTHAINRNIDKDYPATLSPKFLQDILRKKIGFRGVIVSDDMNMGAIVLNYGFEDATVRAVNAGVDMLIFSNNGAEPYDPELPYKAMDAIYQAVKNGKIAREKIEASANRIKLLKQKFKIIQ